MANGFNKAAGNRRKYELITTDTHEFLSLMVRVYRIRALRNFGYVRAGELGGYVQGEENLSHDGLAWVGDNAIVCQGGRVLGNGVVKNSAVVIGQAIVNENACAMGSSILAGKALITGKTTVTGMACVNEDAIVSGNVVVGGKAIINGKEWLCGSESPTVWLEPQPVASN